MKDFIKKTEKELQTLLGEKKLSLRAFRFGSAGSKTKNMKEGRGIRKDIARIMTAMNSKRT
jgi:ribosomal protein L29